MIAVSSVSTRKRRARIAAAKRGWRTRKRRKEAMDRLVGETVKDFVDQITVLHKAADAAGVVVIPPRRSDPDAT